MFESWTGMDERLGPGGCAIAVNQEEGQRPPRQCPGGRDTGLEGKEWVILDSALSGCKPRGAAAPLNFCISIGECGRGLGSKHFEQ